MNKGYDGALGDFGMGAIPNLIYIHNQFARGKEYARWSEGDFFAFERYSDTINANGSPDSGEGLMLVVLNDSGSDQTRNGIQTSFAPGTALKDYTGKNPNTVYVGGDGKVNITVGGWWGQGYGCWAPYNADGPASGSAITFSGTGVGTMPWVIPGGRDAAAKPRTITRLTGDSATIDIYYRNPSVGGETVNNVLVKWGKGLNVGSTPIDGNDLVNYGFAQATWVADGHYKLDIDLRNVPEGLHTVKARLFNGRTNNKPALFQTFTTTVYVDRRGPDLQFVNLNDGETVEGARVVTVNNPDRTLYNLTYKIDGGADQQADMVIRGQWRISLDGLSAGGHTLTLKAIEADYGSTRSVVNTSTETRNFTVDTAGPSISINHAAGTTITEPFFKTVVTVPAGQGIAASDIKLYWNGYEQLPLTENPAGSGNFESTFTGRYVQGGVAKLFTGAFVNGPNFFEAVVTKDGTENRVARKVYFNLFGQYMHDSDGDGLPDEIELSGFLNGTNPGPDVQWPGDNSKDLIPNFGESWSKLNAMNAETYYNGPWDGDLDSDGDGVANLQEVIRGYRLTGNPYRYNIYDANSTPPASTPSAASAVLGTVNGVKTVTITYNPNDGTLNGASPIRVKVTPTGGGSVQFFTMTATNSNAFSYAYTVPSGVTSVAYSFSNADGSLNDTSGTGWSIATPLVASSATATLGASGASKTLTIVYTANEGLLAGQSSVTVNLKPTGAGSDSSATMTSLGNGVFSYTYTIPAGATSVSYTFSNGGTTDSSGGAAWAASTSSGFKMDGEFDSQNFVVADNGMRIYAAIRGNKLYTATWSPKGGGNDNVIYITDTFGDPVGTSAYSGADSGSNYSSWNNSNANGSTGGSGFGAWAISSNNGSGGTAGVFLGDPSAAGISGMNAKSFGLYAKNASGAIVQAYRSLTTPLAVGDSISFQWGINWDSGTGEKGFNIRASDDTHLLNVKNQGSAATILVAGTDSGIGYGTQAMTWTITRTSDTTLSVRASGRDGSTFSRNVTVSNAAPGKIEFYAQNLTDGDQRQPYINDLKIYRNGASAKSGRVFGMFSGLDSSKPWVFATPTVANQYGFKASGKNWMGNAGHALEAEIDLVDVFGQVPKTIFIAAAAYSGGFGGTLQSQAPASFGNSGNDIEIPEFQAVNPASIRDENLDGIFDVGTPYMATVVGDNEADGNYGLRRFYLDEILKESASLTVKFKPNTGAGDLVSNVEVFTNLNRRDFAKLEENPAAVSTTSTDTYFKAYAMSGPDGSGYYTATLPVNRCGAYRLQVRYKVNGGAYTYYTDHAQRRDCAIVVSPKKALKSNMYEVNPLVVEAKDTTFAGRSTFLDLVNDPDLPGESGGYNGRPDALNKNHYAGVGINMLWLQPIHPIGVESKGTDPSTKLPYDPGSPYAVLDYWSVNPALGRSGTAENALGEFQTFVNRLDNWGVGVMMDGTFNHSAPDAIMGQGAADLGLPYSPAGKIRDENHAWFAKEGYPGQAAGSIGEIAIAPDRNDFGNWTDVREFFFGSYDTLVKEKGTQNPDKTYPDNAYKLSFLLERDEFEGHTAQTRQVWEYFAYYPTYWLEKTGHPRGTPKEQSYKGIDGLRCDFAQGLPSQFWEYCINKTRSVKWDFLFMAESLDGYREVNGSKRHGVGYRSARHFDILNENIVFYWRDNFFGYPANQTDSNGNPAANPGTPATPSTGATFNAYDDRRNAFDNVTLLNNLVSHDEVFPHNDVFSIAYAYSQVAAIDGVPMLFYGQEAGAQNSAAEATASPTGGYAATQANFGNINPNRNFAKYESNFGKNIPNFKAYNHMVNIWNDATRDWAVQTFYGRINNTRKSSPALQSQNVYFLNKKASGGGFNNGIFAVGKVQVPGLSAGQQDVMFVFVNNNYRTTASIADTFDLNALAPSGNANYFGIERGKTYNIKDLVSDTPTAYVWNEARTGADILDNGLYVGLPYNGRHAHYLKLVDQSEGAYPDLDGDGLYDQTDADMDGDGISNIYEEANGMNARSAVGADGADADNDHDGYSNYVEYVAGTKANDASSALRVADIASGSNSFTMSWKSVPGAVYKVRYSYDLKSGWSDVEGGLVSADSEQTEVSMSVPANTQRAFYTVSLVP